MQREINLIEIRRIIFRHFNETNDASNTDYVLGLLRDKWLDMYVLSFSEIISKLFKSFKILA